MGVFWVGFHPIQMPTGPAISDGGANHKTAPAGWELEVAGNQACNPIEVRWPADYPGWNRPQDLWHQPTVVDNSQSLTWRAHIRRTK